MPEPGTLIGPYRLLSILGAGAMGEVWRARDERLDRHVAVKLLPAGLAADPERRARMLREARAAAAVPHPHVVTLYDIVSEGERDVLVMELVEGHTLSETIRRGVPEVKEALDWLIGIADALATAHGRGILHRDIKAANMMVTPERTIKVLDFGLAKLRDDATVSVMPAPRSTTERAAIELDATMDSGTGTGTGYQTEAGSLLGTPMYMAPEQIEGQRADERSEVFSVGIVGFEVLTGKPPYTARTLDDLFHQIVHAPLPEWPDRVPTPLRAVIAGALAKDAAARTPTMAAFRDALRDVRGALYAPPRRRWPLAVALAAGALAAAAATWVMVRDPGTPDGPGDAQVRRALEEYDVFYGDKALSSLRAALRVAPDHPRAHAYLILFGQARPEERAAAAAAAEEIAGRARGKDRALLDAAIALHRRGPAAARRALVDAGLADRELGFWAAELAYRAGDYATARAGFAALVDAPEGRAATFLGRIYDHYSSVLIWADDPAEAVRIGQRYHDKFPGEADGAGVYATTLAIAGRLDEALTFAEEALALAEGEDTLAGLGKVHALRGDRALARDHYRRSLARAPDRRRPLRRAALALLQWIDEDLDGARQTVAPCLPGGAEAHVLERGACLFVAGVVDPAATSAAIGALDTLAAAATELAPAYGDPASLADLLRAYQRFGAGGCLKITAPPAPPADALPALEAAWAVPPDFYATYHVPYFATWATCERAALAAALGDPRRAAEILAPAAERAPGRRWLTDDLAVWRGGGP